MKRIVALLLACAFVMGALAAPAMAAKTVVIKTAGRKPKAELKTTGLPNLAKYQTGKANSGIQLTPINSLAGFCLKKKKKKKTRN